jgi:hypothetical protein
MPATQVARSYVENVGGATRQDARDAPAAGAGAQDEEDACVRRAEYPKAIEGGSDLDSWEAYAIHEWRLRQEPLHELRSRCALETPGVHRGSTKSILQTGATVLKWGCLRVVRASTVVERCLDP